MTYASTDPRAQLTPAAAASSDPDDALSPQYLDFHAMAPAETTPAGGRTWIVRGANVVLVYAELADGDRVERDDADETLVLVLPCEGAATLVADGEERSVVGTAVVTVSPGPWSLRADGALRLLRLHPVTASDLLARVQNADAYADGTGNAVAATPWPEPVGDERLRVYDHLEDIAPAQERLGRILRSRHAMVNVLYPRSGPRDPRTLSPHTHDDFEQLSFVDDGRYVHHIRRDWGKDRTRWTPDEHREIGGPSVTVIPPPLVHTSEAIGDGENRMVDIFSGPRADFSARPGWVLNAADYPAAAGEGSA
ncbi:hypothetical protein [Nocardioides hwasunensis]|uniref:Cupin domain-containing protein n=1 Tax=Nocardioides hwasunensis TaxID=397258 RepID=A0ABR8MHQ6_9ACTN|nr:hypothetical protein [Nocardioides hwasunensis]MBD3915597.1 hypothetical protein [Nocardioides hwasunensis]